MNIIILGPQGSGKGTQADALSQKLNIPHISTGDIFRQNLKDKTELGQKINKYLKEGSLVPDEITNELIKDRLQKKDTNNGFILDGYPRNPIQADFLEKIKKTDLVLEIWISDEEAIKRIGGRRSCPKCGTIYHIDYNPSKIHGQCDKCGNELAIREDDQPNAIAKRLKIYHDQTKPLIEYYKEKDIHHKIDGNPPIQEVTEQIMKIFN